MGSTGEAEDELKSRKYDMLCLCLCLCLCVCVCVCVTAVRACMDVPLSVCLSVCLSAGATPAECISHNCRVSCLPLSVCFCAVGGRASTSLCLQDIGVAPRTNATCCSTLCSDYNMATTGLAVVAEKYQYSGAAGSWRRPNALLHDVC